MEKALREPGVKSPVLQVVACDKCENTWLEPVQVNRFLSQEAPIGSVPQSTLADSHMTVLRCVLCGHIMIPATDAYMVRGLTYARFAEMANEVEESFKERLNDSNTAS